MISPRLSSLLSNLLGGADAHYVLGVVQATAADQSTDFGAVREGDIVIELATKEVSKSEGITAASTGDNSVTLSGDHREELPDNKFISISGSTGNDGQYTVRSTSYDEGTDTTTVTVQEDITDGTADGNLIWTSVKGGRMTVTTNGQIPRAAVVDYEYLVLRKY